MKTCADCGHENKDDATACAECRGTTFKNGSVGPVQATDTDIASFVFEPLDEANLDKDWVTLVRCENLPSADAVAMLLRAEKIPVFIPDEYTMQALSLNVNAYGFVRVQVPPSQYQNAREILES